MDDRNYVHSNGSSNRTSDGILYGMSGICTVCHRFAATVAANVVEPEAVVVFETVVVVIESIAVDDPVVVVVAEADVVAVKLRNVKTKLR